MTNIQDYTSKSSSSSNCNVFKQKLIHFFLPLLEVANWLAVMLTLLWLMFVFMMFYSRLPAAETQIVDHTTVKGRIIILDRKTGDDSGRSDGKQWWYMSECDGWNPDRQSCSFAKIKVPLWFIWIAHLLVSLQVRKIIYT